MVSDEDDEDLDGNVDFKTGRPETHRSLAAIAEVTSFPMTKQKRNGRDFSPMIVSPIRRMSRPLVDLYP